MSDGNGWKTGRLGELCSIEIGGTPSRNSPEYWDTSKQTSNLWVSIKDLSNGVITKTAEQITDLGVKHSNVKRQSTGTVLLSFKLTIGRVGIAGVPLYTNEAIAGLRSDEIDPDYLFHGLQHWDLLQGVDQAIKGATLNKEKLKKIEFKYPISKPEQTKIAEVLSTVDRAIGQAETLIAKQQRIKTGLMQDLLTRGIDEHGNLRFEETNEFKDSPLGRIPVEWVVSSVEAEFNLSTGFTLGEHRRPRKNRHPYLRVANVQRERVVLAEVFELEAKDAELAGRSLEEDDLLIVEGHASHDEIGRCARVPSEAVGMTFQNHLFRLRCKRLRSRFALAWLNSEWIRAHWRRLSGTSSGLNTINSTVLKAVPVLVPPVGEQVRIAEILDAQDARVRAEEDYRDKLKLQKTGLMQDLLTGEKRVTPLLAADAEQAGRSTA